VATLEGHVRAILVTRQVAHHTLGQVVVVHGVGSVEFVERALQFVDLAHQRLQRSGDNGCQRIAQCRCRRSHWRF
jgi:hypothetical protein